MIDKDIFFMREALKEANNALQKDEVPIGAIVVCRNQIVAKAHNQVELLKDPTAHAEMIAITSATNYLGNKYLKDCTLYITLEPCAMCAGAMFWSQLGKLVFGAADEKRGYHKANPYIIHKQTEIVSGVLEEECGEIISEFFKKKRSGI